MGWKQVFPTVRYLVAQLNLVLRPFLVFAIVPIVVTPG
jgi:hypothetical protein